MNCVNHMHKNIIAIQIQVIYMILLSNTCNIRICIIRKITNGMCKIMGYQTVALSDNEK